MVRLTAKFGWSLIRLTRSGAGLAEFHVRFVDDENRMHALARATTSAVSQAARIRSISSIGNGVPVGLFGLVSSTIEGLTSAMASSTLSTFSVKSALRWASFQPVKVSRAYSGYMEYVGSAPSAVRPGPPKAGTAGA